jgi:hypothetical protein
MLRRLLTATLVLTGCLVATPVGTTAVQADAELEVATTSTYTIDPAAGVVRVAVEVAVTNVVPDRTEGDIIYSRYYTGYRLPATAASANAAAVDDAGRALTVSAVPTIDAPAYVLYDVEFAEQLFFQQTARFTLTYDIVGLPPRSDDPTRTNRAYFGFDAFGSGDSGKVNVRVVVSTVPLCTRPTPSPTPTRSMSSCRHATTTPSTSPPSPPPTAPSTCGRGRATASGRRS